ncbi:unnamed protein product [Mytilus coruscus]|uniref:Uncharacterized protein n=1 Tax=Mytilus coruscus TaxID=42192 RepID=A0A6J7ZYB5_MYTCO|nr:unnamed protein product [Mytilus coruscus]
MCVQVKAEDIGEDDPFLCGCDRLQNSICSLKRVWTKCNSNLKSSDEDVHIVAISLRVILANPSEHIEKEVDTTRVKMIRHCMDSLSLCGDRKNELDIIHYARSLGSQYSILRDDMTKPAGNNYVNLWIGLCTKAALTFDSGRDEKSKKGDQKIGDGSSKKKETNDVKVPRSSKRKTELDDFVEKVQAQNDKLLGTLRKQHNKKMRKMNKFLTKDVIFS